VGPPHPEVAAMTLVRRAPLAAPALS
jgi:hypothetical protein